MCISALILESIARFRSAEARTLRNDKESCQWELDMMRGAIYKPTRSILEASFTYNNYKNFGIDREWGEMCGMSGNHILVVVNDRMTAFVWDFASTCIMEFESRIITFSEGLPRKQTILLSDQKSELDAFIAGVRLDKMVFDALVLDDQEWSRRFVRTSVFQRTSVEQLWRCLEEEGWEYTERLTMLRAQQHSFYGSIYVACFFSQTSPPPPHTITFPQF